MDSDQKILINELTQGKELANQLRNHLNPSSSPKTRDFLIQKILSTYEKALSMLNCSASLVEPKLHATVSESPFFPNAGPKSEASDQDCKDQCLNKDVYKKRKTLPQWSEQVKVCSGTGLEGPLDDGYCWRKYGQKDILGANYPRGYYRCTHRHAQGCLATKLVQRSDEDPTIFEVTYRGRHTCSQNTQLSWASALSTKAKPKDEQNRYHQQQEQEEKPKQLREMMTNFGTSELKVKTEDLDNKDEIFPLFSFPQAFSEPENVEQDIFGESMLENNFIGSFSPSFFSPTTSESNYFSVSPCHVSNSFGLDQTVNTSESGVSETISAPNSVTNSPIGDFDFSLAKVDLDPNFPFDNLEFFS